MERTAIGAFFCVLSLLSVDLETVHFERVLLGSLPLSVCFVVMLNQAFATRSGETINYSISSSAAVHEYVLNWENGDESIFGCTARVFDFRFDR